GPGRVHAPGVGLRRRAFPRGRHRGVDPRRRSLPSGVLTDAMGTVVRVNQATAPDHVRGAFGVSDGPAVPVVAGSGTGWFVEDAGSTGVVLRPVSDTGLANWSARVREQLDVTGLRVAQPLRSRDGRHVVSGWRADHALSGDRKSTRLNSSHVSISYAVFCLI